MRYFHIFTIQYASIFNKCPISRLNFRWASSLFNIFLTFFLPFLTYLLLFASDTYVTIGFFNFYSFRNSFIIFPTHNFFSKFSSSFACFLVHRYHYSMTINRSEPITGKSVSSLGGFRTLHWLAGLNYESRQQNNSWQLPWSFFSSPSQRGENDISSTHSLFQPHFSLRF